MLSVDAISATSVDLNVNFAQSHNALYEVSVVRVADVAGNEIAAPSNTAQFYGFTPDVPDGRAFEMLDMLPRYNVRIDTSFDMNDFVRVLQDPLNVTLCLIDRWVEIFDPERATGVFLDALLCQLGNPFKFILNETEKRRLLSVLVPIYQSKGTKLGIIDAVFFFMGIEINLVAINEGVSWTLGVSELGEETIFATVNRRLLYSFEVIVPVVLTTAQTATMLSIIDYMKAAHEHIVRVIEPSIPVIDATWILGEGGLGEDAQLAQTVSP